MYDPYVKMPHASVFVADKDGKPVPLFHDAEMTIASPNPLLTDSDGYTHAVYVGERK